MKKEMMTKKKTRKRKEEAKRQKETTKDTMARWWKEGDQVCSMDAPWNM
jgi:regulator of replication initiation timing